MVAEHVESITMKSGLLVELNGNENFAEDIHFRQSKMAVGAGGNLRGSFVFYFVVIGR